MKHTVYGIDTAKGVFQLHSVDMATGEIEKVKLKRDKFLAYFANRQPCLIGMPFAINGSALVNWISRPLRSNTNCKAGSSKTKPPRRLQRFPELAC